MGVNIIKDEIKDIIEALQEQFEVIDSHSNSIPQIELDIILSNVRRLYESLIDLNKINSRTKTSMTEDNKISEKVQSEENPELKNVILVKTEPIQEVGNAVPVEKPIDLFADSKSDLLQETKQDAAKEDQPKEETGRKMKSGKKSGIDLFSVSEKETLADKYKGNQASLHDMIKNEKSEKTVADKIGRTQTTNLKTAIGLNDKFLFINELFKGDILEYNKMLDKINGVSRLEEVTVLMEELKNKYHWEEKPEIYQKLEDLVIKRFL